MSHVIKHGKLNVECDGLHCLELFCAGVGPKIEHKFDKESVQSSWLGNAVCVRLLRCYTFPAASHQHHSACCRWSEGCHLLSHRASCGLWGARLSGKKNKQKWAAHMCATLQFCGRAHLIPLFLWQSATSLTSSMFTKSVKLHDTALLLKNFPWNRVKIVNSIINMTNLLIAQRICKKLHY